jgi:hypothetical protein
MRRRNQMRSPNDSREQASAARKACAPVWRNACGFRSGMPASGPSSARAALTARGTARCRGPGGPAGRHSRRPTASDSPKLSEHHSARAACTAAMSSASSAGVTAIVERNCCECSEPSCSRTRAPASRAMTTPALVSQGRCRAGCRHRAGLRRSRPGRWPKIRASVPVVRRGRAVRLGAGASLPWEMPDGSPGTCSTPAKACSSVLSM